MSDKGIRYNKNKLRYDLVHPKAHKDFVEVLTNAIGKYEERNWEKGLSWTSVLASLKRHIEAFELGEDYDPEDGLLHISHAACNVHFLNSYYYIYPQGDDRSKNFIKLPNIGLDIDGVIANFTKSWHNKYNDVSDSPVSWDYDINMIERFNIMKENNELDDFYLNIEPLIDSKDLKFIPHCYITSRPVDDNITLKWLYKHNFPIRPIYSTEIRKSKVDLAKLADIEVFIDDSYDNFIDLNKNGIFTYLLTSTYNDKYNVGHMRLNSLNDLPFLKV